VDAFARFRGMWGMVLFDLERRELVISRDRLGIKPLYYALQDGWLMLSSEPKAIALASPRGPRAEPFRVHEFLRGLPPQSAELSFFEGVHPFPAGCWARVTLGQPNPGELRPQRYWDLASIQPEDRPESRFEATREEFEQLLLDAVEEHSGAAVELGAMLSGGLDSSTLARLLSQSAARRQAPIPQTFSIIFSDPAMSEWPYIQMVLAQGGLRGSNRLLTADDAWKATPRVVQAQGQPLLGQDTVAQHHAYRLAREHGAIVVIEGQGADELFAGLPGYDAQIFSDLIGRGRWLQAARELRLRRERLRLGWREALQVYLLGPIKRRRMENGGHPRYSWIEAGGVDSAQVGAGRTLDGGPGRTALQRFLFRHVRHTNLPAVLLHQDRSPMANHVESRVPFLDHRIVELAFRLPDSYKVAEGRRKRILLETARRYLPATVVERRDKRSFISRLGWMQLATQRAHELREMAASPELADFAMLRGTQVRCFVDDFLAGRHRDEMAVWRLYTLWHWLLQFRPSL
jgi:asparagine synthase (glutamine-hydrolysing)